MLVFSKICTPFPWHTSSSSIETNPFIWHWNYKRSLNILVAYTIAVPFFLQNIEEILDIILKRPCQLIIMGDFNINLMDSNSSASVDFLSTMLSTGTLSTTSTIARVTNAIASLIDNIFYTLSLKENSIWVSDSSDHFPIYSWFSFKQRKSHQPQVFDSYSIRSGEKELFLLGSKLAEKLVWEC